MKILLVSSYLPFPLYSGGNVRLYNILKKLSEKHEITLVCEIRRWQDEKDILEMEKFCKKVKVVKRKKQWSIRNIIKTGFSKDPFLVVGHRSREMEEIIKDEILANDFNLIHVETFYVMQNLPKIAYKLPIVLVEHNIEYMVYQKYADKASKRLRPFLQIDIGKIKRKEELAWKKATEIVTVSEKEEEIIALKNVYVVSNGVDIEKFKVKKTKSKHNKVLFMGHFKWIQNLNSVNFIINEIWPTVSKKTKDITLWVVGKNIPNELKSRKLKGVIFDENAPDDTEKIYQEASILLAPIFIGGGTSFKILEAMASGIPVVTTSLGAEGIAAKNREEILIGDDAETLISLTIEVIEDFNLRERISKNARALIERKYAWDNIAKELEKVYNRAVGR